MKQINFRGNTKRTLDYIKEHGSITTFDAFEKLGVTRLSAVIFNLRAYGFDIESVPRAGLNRYNEKIHYVEYVLVKNKGKSRKKK